MILVSKNSYKSQVAKRALKRKKTKKKKTNKNASRLRLPRDETERKKKSYTLPQAPSTLRILKEGKKKKKINRFKNPLARFFFPPSRLSPFYFFALHPFPFVTLILVFFLNRLRELLTRIISDPFPPQYLYKALHP